MVITKQTTSNSPLHQLRLEEAKLQLSDFSWESVRRKKTVIRNCKTKKTPRLRKKEAPPKTLNSSLWRIWYTADKLDTPSFLCLKTTDAADLRTQDNGSMSPVPKKMGRKKEITLYKPFMGIIDEDFMSWSGPWLLL